MTDIRRRSAGNNPECVRPLARVVVVVVVVVVVLASVLLDATADGWITAGGLCGDPDPGFPFLFKRSFERPSVRPSKISLQQHASV